MRTPQNSNKRRAEVSEEHLRPWFKEVENYLREKNLLDIDNSRIFNCDESAFFLNLKGNKVIMCKKSNAVYNLVGSDDKECLTALVTGNMINRFVISHGDIQIIYLIIINYVN